MTKQNNLIMAVGLILLITSCTRMHAELDYHIGFLNKTGRQLESVSLYFNNTLVTEASFLVKGGQRRYGSLTLPIPSEAEVRWEDDGKKYAVKTKLKDAVPKRFGKDSIIYFAFNDDGTIEVKAFKLNDTDGIVNFVKEARPKGEYRLGFINKTGRDLAAVSAYFGDERVGPANNLPIRSKVAYSGPLTLPLPSEVGVRWNESGVDHSAKAKLEGVVSNGFAEGTIFFVIKDNDAVEVKAIKWSDSKSSIELMK